MLSNIIISCFAIIYINRKKDLLTGGSEKNFDFFCLIVLFCFLENDNIKLPVDPICISLLCIINSVGAVPVP